MSWHKVFTEPFKLQGLRNGTVYERLHIQTFREGNSFNEYMPECDVLLGQLSDSALTSIHRPERPFSKTTNPALEFGK